MQEPEDKAKWLMSVYDNDKERIFRLISLRIHEICDDSKYSLDTLEKIDCWIQVKNAILEM